MTNESDSYKKAYEREKQARLQAEELLENKTREIYVINEQLKTQALALAKSNEELTHFAFVASHDLKEPLRKIKTFSSFLHEEYGPTLPDDAKDYISRMNNAVDRMDALIEGLLRYSRITRNAEAFTRVDLNTVIQDVTSDLGERIKDTQGKVEITNHLPSLDADAMQMRQLLQNLIGNALKFHQKDKAPVVTVTSKLFKGETKPNHDEAQLCELTITDNGIGFDEKYVDKIFSIFQRLHSQTEYEGSGIGLAICKRIVERHKGSISVNSAVGVGTTFTILLPTTQRS